MLENCSKSRSSWGTLGFDHCATSTWGDGQVIQVATETLAMLHVLSTYAFVSAAPYSPALQGMRGWGDLAPTPQCSCLGSAAVQALGGGQETRCIVLVSRFLFAVCCSSLQASGWHSLILHASCSIGGPWVSFPGLRQAGQMVALRASQRWISSSIPRDFLAPVRTA